MKRGYTNNPNALKDTIIVGADMPSPQRVFSQKYLKVDKTIV
jgi:hypothetical protein